MKIIRVCSFFYPVEGGMETHLLEETKELAKLGHEVVVWTSDSLRAGTSPKKKEEINNVSIERLPTVAKLSYYTPFFPLAWWKALTEDYDILHVNAFRQPHNLTLLIAKLRGKKTVLGVHWPEYPEELRSPLMNLIIPLFDKTLGDLLLYMTDKVIVQTKAEERWLLSKFGKKKNVIILPPGIKKDYLKKRNSTIFRKKHKISGLMVLYLGRIHPSKGIDRIIAIAPQCKEATFVIVGDGPDRKRIENSIREKKIKNVKMIGRCSEEEKMQAYAACDVFLHPTEYDAFGITLIEAMAQAKPVLASHVGGIPSVVGVEGLTFNKEDNQDLIKKLKKL
ncbi:MAG: glycosyltransferase family 4 protein, partial [Candidatus Woesearchaeota archaeon]|nr:glycosyltransferase family 4 protein [Candidatus Woesearchaeota archaeon]